MKQKHQFLVFTAVAGLAISGLASAGKSSRQPMPFVTESPSPEPSGSPTPDPSGSPTPEPTSSPTPSPSGSPVPMHCCVKAYRVQYCGFDDMTFMDDAVRGISSPYLDRAKRLIPKTEACNDPAQWNFIHEFADYDCEANAWSKMKIWYAWADYDIQTWEQCEAVANGYVSTDTNGDGSFNDKLDWDNDDLNSHLGPNPDPFRP